MNKVSEMQNTSNCINIHEIGIRDGMGRDGKGRGIKNI